MTPIEAAAARTIPMKDLIAPGTAGLTEVALARITLMIEADLAHTHQTAGRAEADPALIRIEVDREVTLLMTAVDLAATHLIAGQEVLKVHPVPTLLMIEARVLAIEVRLVPILLMIEARVLVIEALHAPTLLIAEAIARVQLTEIQEGPVHLLLLWIQEDPVHHLHPMRAPEDPVLTLLIAEVGAQLMPMQVGRVRERQTAEARLHLMMETLSQGLEV